MISILLLIALFSWPVIAWKYSRRVKSRDFFAVGVGVFLVGGLLLLGSMYVIHWELHPAMTEAAIVNGGEGSEFSPEGRASRSLSSFCGLLVAPLALLWHIIVSVVELSRSSTVKNTEVNSVSCLECKHELVFDSALSGLDGRCPQCGATFAFPKSQPTGKISPATVSVAFSE